MKSKKAKKIVPLIVLLLVLGALIAATLVLRHYNSIDETGDDDADETVVFDKTGKTVTALEITSGGKALAFSYVNDEWIYDDDEHFPLDGDDVASIAQTLTRVTSKATVDEKSRGEDSEYGLDSPNVTAKASFSDGTAYTFSFGSTNPFNDCQYFRVTGDGNIYMADTSIAISLAHDLDSYYKAETFPLTKDGITADKVTSITVATAAGQENVITDDDGKDELLTLAKTLNLSKWEDYYADADEMLTSYGISDSGDRITVSYTVSSTATDSDGNSVNAEVPVEYTIRLGNMFDVAEGDAGGESGYFYSPVGSTVVYASDSETVKNIYSYLAYRPSDTTTDE